MKVSEITNKEVANHLRVDDENDPAIEIVKEAAVGYVRSYTGLTDEELDKHEDLALAVLIVASDMYDNRSATAKEANANKTLERSLGMHSKNQLPNI